MIFTATELAGAYTIEPEIFKDERGLFYRFFCADEFQQIGHNKPWVQLNHSYTAKQGTIRGMHFQLPPFSEIKMVKCIAGKINDTIIDLRSDSPTFLKWISIELSAENRRMLYIPEGFAHGFQTLADHSEVFYQMAEFYAPDYARGVLWNDPAFGIEWPEAPQVIAARDQAYPDFGV